MATRFLLPVLFALAACGGSDTREAGGLSPAEADALERAAEVLEAERLPAEAIPKAPQPTQAEPVPAPTG